MTQKKKMELFSEKTNKKANTMNVISVNPIRKQKRE